MGIIINGLTDTVTAADGSLNIGGDVTIPGELSYDDVTNIDSVGVITARAGINATGDITFGANSKAKLFENGTQSGVQVTSSTSSAHLMTHDGNEDIHVDPSGYIKFEVAGSERLRIKSDGKLITQSAGYVHTASSAGSLSLYGGNTNLGGGIVLGGGNANADIRFYAQASTATPEERLRITSAGNIGIGIINPAYELEVASSDTTTFNITAGGNTNLSRLFFSDDDTVARGYLNYDHQADSLLIGVAGAEKLRIDSSGRIAQGGKTPTNHGSPNLLLWGADPTMMIASTGSTNNSSFTGIKFAVAGGSTGDYSKAGIFVQRQDSYNDLDMIFAFKSTNDAAGVAISDEKLRIDSDGRFSINHNSPNTRLYVRESGATISNGNAILTSTQKGIRLVNSNNDDTSLGLWFTTGDSHHAGISGQRSNSASNWGTDLRFYTHEGATNDLTYTRERHRITCNGLLTNRKGQNAVNTGGTILGRYKYTQLNQGSGYAHLILGADGRKLQDYVGTNCYCIITVVVTGTGTNNMFCQYYYHATSSGTSSNLTHMYGNSGASSNRPYMNLQNTHDPAWLMSHNGQYRLDIEVAIYGGTEAYTYTSEYGDFTTNP